MTNDTSDSEPMTKFLLLLIFPVTIGIYSCSKYQQVLKSTDLDYKYKMAMQYYNDGEFYKAFPLLEELLALYKGTGKAEKVFYYYAYCNYNLEDYIFASFYFKNFTKTYPNSKHAEECQFMNAYCYYLTSPEYSLDQTNTYKAINELQLFVNMYSQSFRIAECNELIDKLRFKLEMKFYNNAKLYYNIRDYKAAIVAFENLQKDYPDTQFNEDAMFYILKSNYLLAINSIEEKKEERLQSTIKAYQTFYNGNPDGKFAKEIKSIYGNSMKRIENIVPSARD